MTHKDEPFFVDQGNALLKHDYVLIPMKMFYVSNKQTDYYEHSQKIKQVLKIDALLFHYSILLEKPLFRFKYSMHCIC